MKKEILEPDCTAKCALKNQREIGRYGMFEMYDISAAPLY